MPEPQIRYLTFFKFIFPVKEQTFLEIQSSSTGSQVAVINLFGQLFPKISGPEPRAGRAEDEKPRAAPIPFDQLFGQRGRLMM